MYNVMFYITNKTQELFFYNRTNHSRVHQVYIGLTNSWANFADKLNNCTLQQNPRLQQNWTTLKVKSIQISGGLPWLLSALTPEYDIEVPTTPAWSYYYPIHSWSEYGANKVFCFASFSWKFIQFVFGELLKVLNLTDPDSGWIWTMTGGIVSSRRSKQRVSIIRKLVGWQLQQWN